jgi:hypothetical protein
MLVGVVSALVVLTTASSAGTALPARAVAARAPKPPAGAQAWLGHWKTNFGDVIFYDLSWTDNIMDNTGAESSTCASGQCYYHWFLRGMWAWPKHGWVTLKGTPTGKGYATVEPCWLGPYSLEVSHATGKACFPMLLYRYGSEERGGFWKACFLQENCTDHHHLHGSMTGPVWKAGFRFLQRGRPDGHTTIQTQTGGAGTLIFNTSPIAQARNGTRGRAVPGSAAFHLDEIPGAENLSLNVGLKEGVFFRCGLQRQTLALTGLVSSSNDSHCKPEAAYANFILSEGHGGGPDQIKLSINGCRNEQWTSADPTRVSVHLEHPRKIG